MEKLRAIRGGHKSAVTRLINKTEVKIAENDISDQELCTIVENLEKKRDVLKNLDNQIIDITEVEEIEHEILDTTDFTLQMELTIRKFKDMLSNSKANQPQQMVSDFTQFSSHQTTMLNQNSNQTHEDLDRLRNPSSHFPVISSSFYHRLPKLDLPTFSGDILAWQTFWDSFQTTVHSNPSLTNIQRFSYLKSQLIHEAEQCIAGLALTSANYEQAIELLKERFGQKQHIINAHMQNLLQLPNPSLSPASLRSFYDKMENSIRGLESLGQSQDSFGSLLVPIIFSKLPTEMRKTLTREHGNRSWDIRSLREAIGKEAYVQEVGNFKMSDNFTPTASFHTGATSRFKTYEHQNRGNQNRPSTGKVKSCIYCQESHFAAECTQVSTYEKRYAVIKEKRLCFNCFGNHIVSNCTSKYRCRKCNRKHHTSLCDNNHHTDNQTTRQTNTAVNTVNSEVNTQTMTLYTSYDSTVKQRTDVLLKTAVSPVSVGNYSVEVNILLDEGSQKSFITEDLAHKLKLKPCGVATISIAAFGDANRNVRNLEKANVNLETRYGGKIAMEVLIVPTIAAPLSNRIHYEASKLPYLQGLKLAHPVSEEDDFNLGMLIGADFYWDIVDNKIIRGKGPTAVKSKLGYLLSGPMPTTTGSTVSTAMMNVLVQHKKEEVDLERFWKLESMGVTSDETIQKDLTFYETYESTIEYRDNHYIAKLPWKEDFPELPSNYNVTKNRTLSLISRLNREPETMKLYGQIIADQEKQGFIEKVDEIKHPDHKVHYIPHHGVKKDSATTPIRIVYDCSCRESSKKPSLNDCLKTIPPEMNNLTGILARFRLNKYAVTTDIEKAFLQVALHEDDRDVTRFFWFENPNDPTSQLTIYRFRVVLFGTTCSPFILNATILKHLKLNPFRYTDLLKNGLYVDNVLSSFSDEDSLISFYQESRQLFTEGGFNLRSWSSNNSKLCEIADTEDCLDNDKIVKILGLRWNNETDTISFQDNLEFDKERCITKREILQQSAKIFDPLGILSPVTVRAKILMQTLWEKKYEWDQPLPEEIKIKWMEIVQELRKAIAIRIPRCYFSEESIRKDTTPGYVLHVFTDASQRAYGAIVYIVKGNLSSLVMSKNRVAPLKQITLPKLELMGALLGARLAQHVIENLGDMEVNFWSDSQIVLKWISSTKPLKKFIENRVKEIKGTVKTQQWRYCPTDMNPADLLTRGTTANKLTENTFWTQGPTWIPNEENWPIWNGNTITILTATDEDEEQQDLTLSVTTDISVNDRGIHKIINLTRYSSLKKLLRITSYVIRFIKNCRIERKDINASSITVDEIQDAIFVWINNTQETYFPDLLTQNKHSSIVKQLNIYKDERNILRCRGRIGNALIKDSAKYPYLLPNKHPFTSLVVLDAHKNQLHSGVNGTVTHIRQTYWIPRIRQCVRSILRKCVTCRKVTGKPYSIPDPPPLPKERVQDAVPFSVSGVDFAGPLYVRNSEKSKIKVYICLFTCASTRAIHLEIVPNLSESSFILAFRRFSSRKSLPRTLMSDNALTFISASKEIQILTNSPALHENLNTYGTKWKFIPKRAPWFGGFWERMIGLTKVSLKKLLGRSYIDLETLQTVISESM